MVLLFGPGTRHLFGDGQGLPGLGLSPDSIAATSLWEASPSEVAAALAPRYQAALSGEHTSCELVHAGRTYQAQVLPLDPGGAASGMMVMQDITEQRRAQALAVSEAALRATNEQLEAVSRAKSDFISVAAHELKTPITSLRVFATLLIRQLDEGGTIDPERLRRALGMIDQQSDRLSRLINQLLDVSRIEAGRLGLSREIHDLMPIVQMTV